MLDQLERRRAAFEYITVLYNLGDGTGLWPTGTKSLATLGAGWRRENGEPRALSPRSEGPYDTTKITWALFIAVPSTLSAKTVSSYLPAAVNQPVSMVSVESVPGFTTFRLNEAVALPGRPVTDRYTRAWKPFRAFIETV